MKRPELVKEFNKFGEQLKQEGDPDTFGRKALLRVYYQVMCPNKALFDEYTRELERVKFVTNPELVDLLEKQIRAYGWAAFMSALRIIVHKHIGRITKDTVNRRRLQTSLEKLGEVPQTVEWD
jgi:hypothetical protein